MAVANLFILGAPKCGTTSLATWLRQHPAVVAPRVKEPHHYYSPYGEPRSRAEYEGLYADPPDGASVFLDASVWYLFGRTAVPAILEETPDARFVVCLRNPVDMVPSLHAQKLLTGHETIEDLEQAWNVADERAAGSNVGIFGIPDCDPTHMSYKEACLLGAQVRDLLDAVDRSKILFLLLDEIASEPERCWSLICGHAGLEEHPVDLRPDNVAGIRRRSQLGYRVLARVGAARKAIGLSGGTGLVAPLVRWNLRRERYGPVPETLRAEMAAYFHDDVKLLDSLVEQDLSRWLDSEQADR